MCLTLFCSIKRQNSCPCFSVSLSVTLNLIGYSVGGDFQNRSENTLHIRFNCSKNFKYTYVQKYRLMRFDALYD